MWSLKSQMKIFGRGASKVTLKDLESFLKKFSVTFSKTGLVKRILFKDFEIKVGANKTFTNFEEPSVCLSLSVLQYKKSLLP